MNFFRGNMRLSHSIFSSRNHFIVIRRDSFIQCFGVVKSMTDFNRQVTCIDNSMICAYETMDQLPIPSRFLFPFTFAFEYSHRVSSIPHQYHMTARRIQHVTSWDSFSQCEANDRSMFRRLCSDFLM